MRRGELEREGPVRLVGRGPPGGHPVGKGKVEDLGVARHHLAQRRGEVPLLRWRQVAQAPEAVTARPDVDLERPARREWYADREAWVAGNNPSLVNVGLGRQST